MLFYLLFISSVLSDCINPQIKLGQLIKSGYIELEMINFLTENPDLDMTINNDYLIRSASEKGQDKLVRLLLKNPKVNPGADENHAIIYASKNGHLNIVKQLLRDTRVNALDRRAQALKYAYKDPLFPHPNDYSKEFKTKNHEQIAILLVQHVGLVPPPKDDL